MRIDKSNKGRAALRLAATLAVVALVGTGMNRVGLLGLVL
jgi:hypothetical protein